MKTTFYVFILFFISQFIISCEGPQGEVGPQGPAGSKGDQGQKGETGTVNITTSAWISVAGKDWFSFDGDSTYYNIAFREPLITQNLLDKGLIVAYFRFNSDKKYIFPLPSYLLSSKATISFYPNTDKPEPSIVFETEFEKPTSLVDAGTLDFRYIIVPEASLKSGRFKAVNWKNYDEVSKLLELKD